MKNYLIPFFAIALGSCTPITFDENQYLLVSEINSNVEFLEKRICVEKSPWSQLELVTSYVQKFDELELKANTLVAYNKFLPGNAEIFEISKEIQNLVLEWRSGVTDGEFTQFYCIEKAANILTATERVQKTLSKTRKI